MPLPDEGDAPKYENGSNAVLERVLAEGEPRLQHFAKITASLAELERN